MLSTAPMATVNIAVKLKPCAEMKGFSPRENMTNSEPMP